MAQKYVLVIDEGTTGTRALIVNRDSEIIAQAYTEFTHNGKCLHGYEVEEGIHGEKV